MSGSEGSRWVGNGEAMSEDILEVYVRTGELPALRCSMACELDGLRMGVERTFDDSEVVSRIVGLRSNTGESEKDYMSVKDLKDQMVRLVARSWALRHQVSNITNRVPESGAYR